VPPLLKMFGRAGGQGGIPNLECTAYKNALAADRTVRDSTATIDTATGENSIVAAESAVSERHRSRRRGQTACRHVGQ
jgi:hypothetical protein